MPTQPKPITYRKPNPRSGKVGLEPLNIKIPSVVEAQAALEAHQAKMIPHQAPDAPKAMQAARAAWVSRKFELQTALKMAQGAEMNRWKTIFEADPGPEVVPTHGRGWPHKRRAA